MSSTSLYLTDIGRHEMRAHEEVRTTNSIPARGVAAEKIAAPLLREFQFVEADLSPSMAR